MKKKKRNITKNKVLHKLGDTTLTQFAINYKFHQSTVSGVLRRWCGKHGCPRGKVTKKIISALEKEIGCDFYIKD